jgi:endo-1,4-beta-mannosidase
MYKLNKEETDMGQMKELVMNLEEQVCENCYYEADDCKNFAEFHELVLNAYKSEDYLFAYAQHSPDYIQEVASQMWFEELGNTI